MSKEILYLEPLCLFKGQDVLRKHPTPPASGITLGITPEFASVQLKTSTRAFSFAICFYKWGAEGLLSFLCIVLVLSLVRHRSLDIVFKEKSLYKNSINVLCYKYI